MAKQIELTIKGLEKLEKKLGGLSNVMVRQQMERTMLRSAEMIKNRARQLVPVDTGTLRRSIRDIIQVGEREIKGIVGPTEPYGAPVEFGCYDEKTEVLTQDGWKYFKNVEKKDKIATLNPKNREIEYNPVIQLFQYEYKGKLLKIENRTLDIVVTPNHEFPIFDRNRKNFQIVRGDNLPTRAIIPRSGNWKGKEVEWFVLPEYTENHWLGKYKKYVPLKRKGIKIKTDDWLRFLGIYLAEGYTDGYRVVISQKVKKKEVREILSKLPFRVEEKVDRNNRIDFRINNVQLASYLKQFKKCDEKFIPKEIKFLSKRQLEILLDAMILGDGSVFNNGNGNWYRRYYTTSKRLADDVQEIMLKIGRLGIISERKSNRKAFGKYERKKQYEVFERTNTDSWIDKRNISLIDYQGKIYCLNVKNHIIYVRRNGKPCWCGNSRPHFPPVQALERWAEKRGINPWALAVSISRKGTRARPFLIPAFRELERKILEEFKNAIDYLLSK